MSEAARTAVAFAGRRLPAARVPAACFLAALAISGNAALPEEAAPSPGRRLLAEGVDLRKNRPSEAAPVLREALRLLEDDTDLAGQAEAHRNLGILSRQEGRPEEALRSYQVALGLARASGDATVRSEVLNSLGILYRSLGDMEKALDVAAEGLALARAAGDVIAQARLLGSMARAYEETGDLAVSERAGRLALLLAERGGAPPDLVANLIGRIGVLLAKRGEVLEALRAFDRFDAIAGLPPMGRYAAENTRALIYRGLGDLPRAADHARRALEAARLGAPPADVLGCMYNLALILQDMGDLVSARSLLAESLGGFEKLGDRSKTVYALNGLAMLSLAEGDVEAAAAWNDRALALITGPGALDVYPTDEAHRTRSRIARHRGDLDAARRHAEEALAWAHAAGPEGRADTLEWLGELEVEAGRPSEAERSFREAIAIRKELRSGLPAEMRLTLSRGRARPWRLLAALLLERGRAEDRRDLTEEALRVLDESRALSFLEMLESARPREAPEVRGAPGPPSEASDAARAVAAIQAELIGAEGNPIRRRALRRRLFLAEEDLDAERRRAEGPGAVPAPGPLDVEDLRWALGAGGALLASFLVEPGEGWVLLAGGSGVEALRLDAPEEILRTAALLDPLLAARPEAAPVPDPLPALDRLAALILDPWAGRLGPQTRKVFIAADGALERVPFEALRIHAGSGRGRFLVEKAAVAYLPSASSWLRLRRRPRPEGARPARRARVLAVADPRLGAGAEEVAPRLGPLPWSRGEAASLLAMASRGSRLLAGPAATEEAWKGEDLTRYDLIHVAAHGIADPAHPLRAGVLLAPGPAGDDGLVQMREILGSPLGAELVVLSACRTAFGPTDRAEGTVSLPLAFLQAGARSVVATLWEVEDRTASAFMKTFYAEVARGESTLEALRAAKVSLIRSDDPARRDPRAWAAFILVGDGEGSVRLGGSIVSLAVTLAAGAAAGAALWVRRRATPGRYLAGAIRKPV